MKVYLNKYRNHWLSPYTILKKVFFWREIEYDEPIIEKLSSILEPFCRAWQKFLNFVHPPISYVKIDYWDTWSMDSTLAHIILPMLKQLKETNHGAPIVDDKDVPKELRSTSAPPKENEWDTDENHFKRWDWVMNELIWTFEQLVDDDNDAQFHSGNHDLKTEPCEWDKNGKPTLYQMVKGPNDTHVFDSKGYKKHQERINNGLKLFGKYYRNLWD